MKATINTVIAEIAAAVPPKRELGASFLHILIVYGEAGCFLAVVLAFVDWWLKTRREEEFMTQQFGEEYRRYQRNVKRLIPFVL